MGRTWRRMKRRITFVERLRGGLQAKTQPNRVAMPKEGLLKREEKVKNKGNSRPLLFEIPKQPGC